MQIKGSTDSQGEREDALGSGFLSEGFSKLFFGGGQARSPSILALWMQKSYELNSYLMKTHRRGRWRLGDPGLDCATVGWETLGVWLTSLGIYFLNNLSTQGGAWLTDWSLIGRCTGINGFPQGHSSRRTQFYHQSGQTFPTSLFRSSLPWTWATTFFM